MQRLDWGGDGDDIVDVDNGDGDNSILYINVQIDRDSGRM